MTETSGISGDDSATSRTSALEIRLLRLLDKADIVDILNQYIDGVGRRDGETIASCFTADARIEYDFATLVGRTEIDAFFSRMRPGMAVLDLDSASSTTQVLSNIVIDLEGDRAAVRSTGVSYHGGRRSGEPLVIMRSLLYHDEFLRTASGWLINHRTHTPQWMVELPARDVSEPPVDSSG